MAWLLSKWKLIGQPHKNRQDKFKKVKKCDKIYNEKGS